MENMNTGWEPNLLNVSKQNKLTNEELTSPPMAKPRIIELGRTKKLIE